MLCLISLTSTPLAPFPFPTPKSFIPQLLSLCVQCLVAVAKALPPDYVEPGCLSQVDRITSVDTDGYFEPQPVDTSKYETSQT